MDNLQEKFMEEANELLSDLETALLALEQEPEDEQKIQQVFRVMHTLKGNAAMFGYETMSDLTHHLESAYDAIRNGEKKLTTPLLNLSLSTLDHLHELLKNPEDVAIQNTTSRLIQEVESFNQQGSEDANTNSPSPKSISQDWHSYHISFHPHNDFFQTGNNPLYLLDDLQNLGKTQVISHTQALPDFASLQVEASYFYWDIILVTQEDFDAVHDVFLFVEGDADIQINKLADKDLLAFPEFCEYLELQSQSLKFASLQIAVEDLLVKKHKQQIAPNQQSKAEQIISSIRVSSEKLDQQMNLVSELVTMQARLSLFAERNNDFELDAIVESMEKISRQLRDNTFSIYLVPLESVATRFQRLVRDTANELGKQIEFNTEGLETELDKNIIESLMDPIMHILRNSIDHGVEPVAMRLAQGKPAKGHITLKAFYSGANVNIKISDDGKGIDLDRIKQKGIDKGLVSAGESLSERDILNLVFQPGLTTNEAVTELSGRGVGMDVVRRKISNLRGEVEINTEAGKGTDIIIKLPLTLSIIDGLLVRINQTYFVIPLASVGKCYEVPYQEVEEHFNNLVVLDGEQYPFFNLRDELEMGGEKPKYAQIIVVSYEDKQVGLTADAIVGEYQAVLKTLGSFYKDTEFISGATILGDGTLALILDPNKLIKGLADKLPELQET